MSWNKRLKEARLNAKMNKSELARAIGVSVPTIFDWEAENIKKIDGENLLRAAAALGVSAEWIMFGTPKVSPSAEAAAVAAAFDQLTDPAQRGAITSMLRAWGMLK